MADEDKNKKNPDSGNASASGQGAGGKGGSGDESGQNAGGKGGGDLSVALKQEREKARAAKEENQQLREQLEQLQQQNGTSEAAGDLDLSDFEISDDDLIDGNAETVNQKLRGAIQSVYRKAQEDIRHQLKSQETAKTVDGIMGEFSIFQDEDDELRNDANAAAVQAVKNLPDNYTSDDLRTALQGVAQRFSRYKVARTNGSGGGGEGNGGEGDGGGGSAGEPVGAPGSSDAAHLDQDKAPETWDEAKSLADKITGQFLKKKSQQ